MVYTEEYHIRKRKGNTYLLMPDPVSVNEARPRTESRGSRGGYGGGKGGQGGSRGGYGGGR